MARSIRSRMDRPKRAANELRLAPAYCKNFRKAFEQRILFRVDHKAKMHERFVLWCPACREERANVDVA